MEFDQRDLEPAKKGIRGIYAVMGLVGLTGLAVYFAVYKPLYVDIEKYKRAQKENKKAMEQRKREEGGSNLPVWSSPYKPRPGESK